MKDQLEQATASIDVQLPEWLNERVREEATIERRSPGDMVRVLAEEGLVARAFPSIVFVDGPTGRRAAFRDGPDVWEIIETYLVSGKDPALTAQSRPHLSPWKVQTAIRFYQNFPSEIEARIQRNASG